MYAAATLTAPASSNTGNYTVSWTVVTSATAYRLDEKAGSGSWTQVANAAATSKGFTGKADGTYQYRVRGCNTAGCGAYSAAKATVVTLPSLPPATPTGVQGEYFDNEITPYKTTYLFSWNASEGASYYELSPSYGSSQILGTFYRHVVSGIQGPVSFRVRACNTNGCSAWSPEVETEHL